MKYDQNQDRNQGQDVGNDSREEPPRRPTTNSLRQTYHVMPDGTVSFSRAEALEAKQGR